MSQDHRLSPAAAETVVLTRRENGVAEIPRPTPLTRLHYFDGKFLRADDLALEQDYLRRQIQLSSLAGGSGVVYGYDLDLAPGGDALVLGPGLAFDPAGRALLLPSGEVQLSIAELIAASSRVAPPSRKERVRGSFGDCEIVAGETPGGPRGADLYLITLGWAEALCGEEDVYGKVCAEACITSTDRPYFVEGVIVRAVPLTLATPLATSAVVALSQRHLRSLVASAYFADETLRVGSWISKAGLLQDGWCRGAQAPAGGDVPVGVLARAGSQTVFLDPWTSRRERIETPPRRYWAWRMAMRPWDVFLAQVLQFQCQLHDVYRTLPEAGGDDPCREANQLLAEAGEALAHLTRFYRDVSSRLASFASAPATSALFDLGGSGASGVNAVYERVQAARRAVALAPTDRLLIRGGIVELPSAGYLPVVPGAVSVNRQVRALLGEGVDLRFCVVRPDYVPHALEEAQHMDRISLLSGLDDPEHKPKVDILVPDGEIVARDQVVTGRGFATTALLSPEILEQDGDPQSVPSTHLAAAASPFAARGAGRAELLPSGGGAFHFAGGSEAPVAVLQALAQGYSRLAAKDKSSQTALRDLAASSSQSGAGDTGSVSRLIYLAGRAQRYSAALASRGSSARAFSPALSDNERPAHLWLTSRCDANPFALGAGASTAVSLRAVLAVPGTGSALLDFQLRGELRIDRGFTGAGGARRLEGRLSGFASERLEGGGVADDERTAAIDWPAQLTLSTNADGRSELVAEFDDPGEFTLRLTAQWQDDPLQALVHLDFQDADAVGGAVPEPLRLLSLGGVADDAVLTPGNALHTVSLASLEVLGATLQDAGFAAASGRLLFPPPATNPEELIVRGTRDWVLFHRRRDKRCGTPVEAPPPVALRRYALFQLEVADNRILDQVRTALLSNNAAVLGRFPFKAVDHVEFAAGAANLSSDPEDLRDDWQQVVTGQGIVYGCIATQGLGDGAGLAEQRLLRVEEALAPVAPRDPESLAEVLPQVPQRFAAAGTDGAVVLLSRPRQSCHQVYRIQPQHRDEALSLIADDKLATLLSGGATGAQLVLALGDVEFPAGTANGKPEDITRVQNDWSIAGGGTAERAFVFSRVNDPEAEVASVRTARGRALVQALGGSATSPVELHEIAADVSNDCPVITLILPLPVTLRQVAVYRVKEDANVIGQAQIFLDQNPPNLQSLFNPSAALVVRLGEIPFLVGDGNFDTNSESAKSVRDNYQATGGTGFDPSQGFVFSKTGDPVAETTATRFTRGQNIMGFLTGGLSVQTREVATAPPDPQPVVLVILPNLISNNPSVPRLAAETAAAPEKAAPAKKPAARARTARKKA